MPRDIDDIVENMMSDRDLRIDKSLSATRSKNIVDWEEHEDCYVFLIPDTPREAQFAFHNDELFHLAVEKYGERELMVSSKVLSDNLGKKLAVDKELMSSRVHREFDGEPKRKSVDLDKVIEYRSNKSSTTEKFTQKVRTLFSRF